MTHYFVVGIIMIFIIRHNGVFIIFFWRVNIHKVILNNYKKLSQPVFHLEIENTNYSV